jgi:hypothetical protein
LRLFGAGAHGCKGNFYQDLIRRWSEDLELVEIGYFRCRPKDAVSIYNRTVFGESGEWKFYASPCLDAKAAEWVVESRP